MSKWKRWRQSSGNRKLKKQSAGQNKPRSRRKTTMTTGFLWNTVTNFLFLLHLLIILPNLLHRLDHQHAVQCRKRILSQPRKYPILPPYDPQTLKRKSVVRFLTTIIVKVSSPRQSLKIVGIHSHKICP